MGRRRGRDAGSVSVLGIILALRWTRLGDALPSLTEEDMTKHLFGAMDETTFPVQEYMIHLAPEEDYILGREEIDPDLYDPLVLLEKRKRLQQDHPHDHVRPYFLRESAVGKTKPRIVNFYSPFCGHCIRFRSRYIEIAREVNERAMVSKAESPEDLSNNLLLHQHFENDDYESLPVEFHAISCSEFHRVCQDNQVKGFPTVVAYPSVHSAEGDGEEAPPGVVLGIITAETIAEALNISLRKPGETLKSARDRLATPSNDFDPKLGRNQNHDALGMAYTLQSHTQKDTFYDAALSCTHALKHYIFPARSAEDHTSSAPLLPERREAFVEWVDLLFWALPPTWKLHIIFHEIRSHRDAATSSATELAAIVDGRHEVVHDRQDNKQWTASCRKPGHRVATLGQQKYKEWLLGTSETSKVQEPPEENGNLCGFWNLLHIASVGVSERHKAVLGGRNRVSTAHAAKTIRNYIDRFLPQMCPRCREQFLSVFDTGGLRLRQRLKQPKAHTTFKNNHPRAPSEESWNELALWMWELHNEINVRLLREEYMARAAAAEVLTHYKASKSNVMVPTLDEEDAVRWPSRTACPACWLDNRVPNATATSGAETGTSKNKGLVAAGYNKTAVYQHLKQEYWPRGPQHFRFVVLDQAESKPVHHLTWKEEIKFFFIARPWHIKCGAIVAILLGLYVVFLLHSKWQRRLTGRHKKL